MIMHPTSHQRLWTRLLVGVLITMTVIACNALPRPSGPQPTPVVFAPSPELSPMPTGACAIADQWAAIPSDRLINIWTHMGIESDAVVFAFGPSSAERPQGPAHVELTTVEPPFYLGQSTEAADIEGTRHLLVRFEGMTLADEADDFVYGGPMALKSVGIGLAEVRLMDASEGVMTFIVGYDNEACPLLTAGEAGVTLTLPR